jgi:hypothetical protein
MRKKRLSLSLRLAALAAACALLLFAAETLVVKIQTTQLRRNPQFFAPAVATLKAGDRLEKLSEAAGWIQVRTSAGAVGWVHGSAVETPRFRLLATGTDMKTQATASEVALAGKGFNKQVEDSYRARNSSVSYVWVDRMVQLRVSTAQAQEFLKRGRLAGSGGAQ